MIIIFLSINLIVAIFAVFLEHCNPLNFDWSENMDQKYFLQIHMQGKSCACIFSKALSDMGRLVYIAQIPWKLQVYAILSVFPGIEEKIIWFINAFYLLVLT